MADGGGESVRSTDKEPTADCLKKANKFANKDGKYAYIDIIGQGGFGTVLLAKDIEGNQYVAVKTIKVSKSTLDVIFRKKSSVIVEAKQEADMLKKLEHKNIVELKEFFKYKESTRTQGLAIVMEYCPKSSLQAYLNAMKQINPFEKRKRWYIQLSSAIEFIHSKGIAHRDIKPDNVLLDWNEDLKVADVGLAKTLWEADTEDQTTTTLGQYLCQGAGTPCYIAPEVLSGHYDKRCDIFSLGLVFVAIARPAIDGIWYPMAQLGSKSHCLGELLRSIPDLDKKSLEEIFGVDFRHLVPGEAPIITSMLKCDYNDRITLNEVTARSNDLREPIPKPQATHVPTDETQPSDQQENTDQENNGSWCVIS